MSTLEEIKRYAEHALSSKRFNHVRGVVSSISELARIYGADENAAITAAWLHDIAREWDKEHLLEIADKAGVENEFRSVKELLHGPVAAWLGKTEFGIQEKSILDAVCYHTTGRPDMSLLDKLLFVADAIEPSRSYPGVEKIRILAKDKLNLAVLASIDSTITYLIQNQQPTAILTVKTRNALLEQFFKTSLKRQEM
jgi:predicted HD superfamily hydrolase involved in NAD metabolism